jgi:hypothetical protein
MASITIALPACQNQYFSLQKSIPWAYSNQEEWGEIYQKYCRWQHPGWEEKFELCYDKLHLEEDGAYTVRVSYSCHIIHCDLQFIDSQLIRSDPGERQRSG